MHEGRPGAEAATEPPLSLWEEPLKGMQGPFSLSGVPYCCPPQALGTRAQAGWPRDDPSSSRTSSHTTHHLLGNSSQ